MTDQPKLTAADVQVLLYHRYPKDKGWFYLSEVELSVPPLESGERKSRRIDGLAIGLYGSNAHEVQGFEVKVNRSDWLAELKDPSKAEHHMQVCNRWWLVCPPDVAKEDEVPKTWGLLHCTDKSIRLKRQAPERQSATRDEAFWAGLLRRVIWREWNALEIFAAERKARETAEAEYRVRLEKIETRSPEVKHKLEDAERLFQQVLDFEQASGIKLSAWSGGRELGDVVKLIRSHGAAQMARDVANQAFRLDEASKTLREIHQGLLRIMHPGDAA